MFMGFLAQNQMNAIQTNVKYPFLLKIQTQICSSVHRQLKGYINQSIRQKYTPPLFCIASSFFYPKEPSYYIRNSYYHERFANVFLVFIHLENVRYISYIHSVSFQPIEVLIQMVLKSFSEPAVFRSSMCASLRFFLLNICFHTSNILSRCPLNSHFLEVFLKISRSFKSCKTCRACRNCRNCGTCWTCRNCRTF